MSTNPYRSLKDKLIACLKIEAKLSAEEREANQFSFLTKLGTTQVTLIKGGVNTIALQFGTGERKVMYPDDALEMLDKLAARPHWYYRVNGRGFPEGGANLFHITKLLRERPPQSPGKIVGIGPKGEVDLYVAKPTLKGGFEWTEK